MPFESDNSNDNCPSMRIPFHNTSSTARKTTTRARVVLNLNRLPRVDDWTKTMDSEI